MLEGYDISKWQQYTPALKGMSFIILRASIATTKDTRYDYHYANARKAGVVTMAYHYGYPDDEAKIEDQVALFLDVAKDADYLWLDQEQSGFNDAQAQKFIDLVRASGRPCGLYHSASGFGGVRSDAKWVADWRASSVEAGFPRTADGTKEFPGWDIWQYNGSGEDKIDNDYMNPASPLASLLRQGYTPDADVDLLRGELDAVQSSLELLETELQETRDALAAALLEIPLAEGRARVEERNRIAEAEAARIRAI